MKLIENCYCQLYFVKKFQYSGRVLLTNNLLPHHMIGVFYLTYNQMYLDLFEREGKMGGAMLMSFRFQHKENGTNEISVSYNHCNCQNPVGDDPALMTLWDMETFLHELGHGCVFEEF